MRGIFGFANPASLMVLAALGTCSLPVRCQTSDQAGAVWGHRPQVPAGTEVNWRPTTPITYGTATETEEADGGWVASPGEPARGVSTGIGDERGNVPWAAREHQQPFSRIGIGADVSPLGIGIKPAVVLTQYFDARGLINFFNYDSGTFELEGFRVDAKLHMASVGASVDCYPRNSIWRLSAGLMFFNGNQLSATTEIVPGTSFKLNSQTFYSATANPLTGATPLTGTGVLAMHRNQPAFMASFGFGKFIPRSNRHWSFPSEFGVILTGSPTIAVNAGGWACRDKMQTQCSNIGDPANPIAIQFNNALQAQLTKWRKALSSVTLYPLFSYSVVYSFNIR